MADAIQAAHQAIKRLNRASDRVAEATERYEAIKARRVEMQAAYLAKYGRPCPVSP